jgi:tetratricopeptide (TPR) repeat protein
LFDQSKYEQSRAYLTKSLTIQEEIGDRRGIAACLNWLGLNALFQGDIEGERLIRESVAIYTAMGDRLRVLEGIELASIALMVLGRFEEARALMEEMGMADARSIIRNDAAQSVLASALIHLGKHAEARDRAEVGLALARRLGDAYGLGFALLVRGWLALVDGENARAFDLFRESARVCEQHDLKDVFTWARSSQGFAAHRLGNLDSAQQAIATALQTAVEIESFVGMVFAVTFSLPLVVDMSGSELAVELHTAICQFPMMANSHFFGDLICDPLEALAAELPPEVAARAKERGQGLGLDDMVGVILVDRRFDPSGET